MNGQLVKIKVQYGNALSISYESTSVDRHYLSFNLMLLCGVWLQCIPTDYKKDLSGYIVRRFSNGYLGAIPSELDVSCLDTDMQSFERGAVWPLNDYRF